MQKYTNYGAFIFYTFKAVLFLILHMEYICALRQYNLRDMPIQVSSAWQLIKNQFTGLRVMPVTHRNQSICM